MATADEQAPPVPPEAPLGLGVRPRSPLPSRSDARSPPLDEDMRDLRLEEGDAEKDGEESGSEASEEDGEEGDEKKGKLSTGKPFYPRRPGEADCVFYVHRGKCAFGSKCRFNHPPLGKKREQVQSEATSELGQATKVDVKEMGEEKNSEKVGNLRCKYFDTPGGCKYGSACRYNHIEEKKEAELVELNFLGLPLRPGEKECPFYMQKGSCKFSTSCKYHHPDPSVSGGSNAQTGHFGSGFSHLNVSGVPHIPAPFHAPQRIPTNSFPYIHGPPYGPPMPAVHQHPVHLNSGWNRYQHPMDLPFTPEGSGRYMPIPPPTQAPLKNSNKATIHQQHNQIAEFPQRPGQPDCPYYMKSGDCKFKSACKFNHPKDRHSPACLLSPKGLPIRPGQSVCTHYSRYGICKFGPTCIYDHPVDHIPSQTMAQ